MYNSSTSADKNPPVLGVEMGLGTLRWGRRGVTRCVLPAGCGLDPGVSRLPLWACSFSACQLQGDCPVAGRCMLPEPRTLPGAGRLQLTVGAGTIRL